MLLFTVDDADIVYWRQMMDCAGVQLFFHYINKLNISENFIYSSVHRFINRLAWKNQLYWYAAFFCVSVWFLCLLAGQQFDSLILCVQEAKRISKVLQKFGAPEITSSLTGLEGKWCRHLNFPIHTDSSYAGFCNIIYIIYNYIYIYLSSICILLLQFMVLSPIDVVEKCKDCILTLSVTADGLRAFQDHSRAQASKVSFLLVTDSTKARHRSLPFEDRVMTWKARKRSRNAMTAQCWRQGFKSSNLYFDTLSYWCTPHGNQIDGRKVLV